MTLRWTTTYIILGYFLWLSADIFSCLYFAIISIKHLKCLTLTYFCSLQFGSYSSKCFAFSGKNITCYKTSLSTPTACYRKDTLMRLALSSIACLFCANIRHTGKSLFSRECALTIYRHFSLTIFTIYKYIFMLILF